MPETAEQLEAMFPKLDDAQVARLADFGRQRRAAADEILFDLGDADHGVFVVLSGRIEVANVSNGEESVLRSLGRGEFTGELTLLSGRRSLVRCRARESSVLLEIDRPGLRRIMQTDAALGETFLR